MDLPQPATPDNPTHSKRRVAIPPMGRWRFTGTGVLCMLVLSVITAPFLEGSDAGLLVESAMVSLVLASAVLAVGGKPRTLIMALALAIPAMAFKWLHFVRPASVPPELHLTFAILTIGFVALQFLRYILAAKRVDTSVLCTGIAAFLLVAVLWSLLYQIIDRQVPGSFTFTVGSQPNKEMKGPMALYFSFITLCTVGYGDIVPTSAVARMCAMLEGATGVFFIAVLISRLMSLYTADPSTNPQKEALPDTAPPRAPNAKIES